MPLKPGVRCATKTKNNGGKYTICWGEKKKPVKTTPKKTIKVSTKPVKAPKKSVTKKEPIITKPPIRRLETGALMVGKTLKAAPKPAPKKDSFNINLLEITPEEDNGFDYRYYDKDNNIAFRFFKFKDKIRKDAIKLSYMNSAEYESKPPAARGLTRNILCSMIKYLVTKKVVTQDGTLSLTAGKVQAKIPGRTPSLKKLKEMYIKMGFTPIKDDHNGFSIKIGNMLKWCNDTYGDFD